MDSGPNILFILTDDQGIWASGCYGNPEIRTPNLDHIAATGMRFENFFVSMPVCSPSRATFLTGRIASQHGVHDWIRGGNVGPDASSYLEGEVAYTDVLAAHGWTCGLSGKWHLGNSQIPQHGFGHWFAHQLGGGPYNDAPMVRNGERVDEPGYVTDVITDDALEFLQRHGRDQAPFYLSVHYTAPHSPWTGHPQEIVDSYDDCAFESCPQEPIHPWAVGHALSEQCLGNREMLKGYFAAITAMDANVGRLPGQSFLPTLLGQEDAGRESVVVYDEYGSTRMVRTAAWKYVDRGPDGLRELYDLSRDPDERHNRADDPNQSGRIEALKAVLEKWFERYVETERDGRAYQVTGKGQLHPVGGRWENQTEPFAQE